MNLKHYSYKVALGVMAAALCSVVGAQTTLTDVGPNGGTTTHYQTYKGSSGQGLTSYAPDRTLSDGSSNFSAYCIDPLTSFRSGQTYLTTSLDNFLNGATTSGYASQIGRTGYSGYGLSNTAATQSRVLNDLKELFSWAYNDSQLNAAKSAAFGMAIWEIILQDGGTNGASYNKDANRLRSYGSSTNNAADLVDTATNAYLSALNSNSWSTLLGSGATQTNWTYTVYYDSSSPLSQGFLRVTAPPTPPRQGVPEPGSLALAGLALVGVLVIPRRKARSLR